MRVRPARGAEGGWRERENRREGPRERDRERWEDEEDEQRANEGEREKRGVSMATRRGGNATVTMAAAGYSLAHSLPNLSLPLLVLSSLHLDLFLPPTDRAREHRQIREEKRWSRHGAALWRKPSLPFRFFSPSPPLLTPPLRAFSFNNNNASLLRRALRDTTLDK